MVAYTKEKYGKALCADCAKKVAEATEAVKNDEADK